MTPMYVTIEVPWMIASCDPSQAVRPTSPNHSRSRRSTVEWGVGFPETVVALRLMFGDGQVIQLPFGVRYIMYNLDGGICQTSCHRCWTLSSVTAWNDHGSGEPPVWYSDVLVFQGTIFHLPKHSNDSKHLPLVPQNGIGFETPDSNPNPYEERFAAPNPKRDGAPYDSMIKRWSRLPWSPSFRCRSRRPIDIPRGTARPARHDALAPRRPFFRMATERGNTDRSLPLRGQVRQGFKVGPFRLSDVGMHPKKGGLLFFCVFKAIIQIKPGPSDGVLTGCLLTNPQVELLKLIIPF